MKKIKNNYKLYLLLGYTSALIIEYLSYRHGDSKLFTNHLWFIGFIIWYGLLLNLSYFIMRHWKIWQIVLVWAILGPIIELTLFRGSFLLSDIFYGLIFALPFWLSRKFTK